MVAKVKPKINSVEVHPQLSNNGHPVDGALMGFSFLSLCHPMLTSFSLSFLSPDLCFFIYNNY
jgi:hypothetical protein